MQIIRKRRVFVVVAAVIASVALATLIGIIATALYTARNINFEVDEKMFSAAAKWSSTTFYADSDRSDDEYTPVEVDTSGNLKKEFYPLENISTYLKDGFIAVEDKIFYQHNGVDVKRTVYAALNYLFGKGKTFGASTITQQVVKNVSGDNEPTVLRKFTEIIRAANIEQSYSKDEILEVYLNIVPMSESIYGVGLASKVYFGKEPSELSAAEAATLIGITNATTSYNPYKNPKACLEKRNTVLSVMRDDGIISEAEYLSEAATPLSVIARGERKDIYDSWFTETVIEDIVSDYSKEYGVSENAARILLLGGGYSVYTTMDTRVQRVVEKYFENTDNFPTEVSDGLNFAMAITDPYSGDLVAIAGNVGEKRANRLLNHATVPHTPASTLKPLALYAPLIDEGRINWATVFDDVPVSFSKVNGDYVEYPRNSPALYDGLTTVSEALRLSKNTVAVRLYNMRGAEKIFSELTEKFGITTLVRSEKTANGNIVTDLAASPLALGQLSRGVSLRKLTECYGAFAAEGVLSKGRSYLKVVDSDGQEVLNNLPEQNRVFSEATAQIMNQLLSQVTDSGTARQITLKETVSVAGKTGTSGGNLDRLFVGYTPYYAAGIWCGYDNGTATPVSSPSHLRIWDEVMSEIHLSALSVEKQRKFATDKTVYRSYCMDSGGLYTDNCIYDPRGTRQAYGFFTADNAPDSLCGRHVLCEYDSNEKGVATHGCPRENIVTVSLLDISDREFPKEIYVTDAEYVYRGECVANDKEPRVGIEEGLLPYFYSELPDGTYVGISKRHRQFNARCPSHSRTA